MYASMLAKMKQVFGKTVKRPGPAHCRPSIVRIMGAGVMLSLPGAQVSISIP